MTDTMHWPVSSSISISRGAAEHIADGEEAALDFASPYGTPTFACEEGLVSVAGTAGDCGLAVFVILDRGTVLRRARYCHHQSILVSAGERVTRGQQIGEVGSTGLATGPHLHFALERWDGNQYIRIQNPEEYISTEELPVSELIPDPVTVLSSLELLWDRIDRIQQSASGQTTEDIISLAEEAKQYGIVAIKGLIGIS